MLHFIWEDGKSIGALEWRVAGAVSWPIAMAILCEIPPKSEEKEECPQEKGKWSMFAKSFFSYKPKFLSL